jgi:thiamine biosynthesis lipoprotein
MSSCLKSEIRRCRPLLGTFVKITALGPVEGELNTAVNRAFAAVERIQQRMSVHDADSEISRLNREAFRHAVKVSAETFTVLRHADRIACDSGGAFDYTVGPTLARWGYRPGALWRREPHGYKYVVLQRGQRVRFLRPLALDLGGIAKGFAVDAAIEALRERGVTAAVVNAGGDLRVFGPQPSMIHLRHPVQPQSLAHTVFLQHAALATSSPCFTEKDWRRERVSHLVNPLQPNAAVTGGVSVSVRASECWLADALTKVVLNAPGCAETLLQKYDAEAFVLAA